MITTKTQRDMEMTRKQIEVTKEVRKEIKAAFKCSNMAIWRALSFTLDTPLSLLLTPAMETIHDRDGFMRQYFENGAMVEADKNTGTVQVFDKDGAVRHEVEHCMVEQLSDIQAIAAQL